MSRNLLLARVRIPQKQTDRLAGEPKFHASPPLHAAEHAIDDNGEVTDTRLARAQLVIFDLDGTLTDSAEGIVASFLHALGHIGAPVPDGDLVARIVGPPMDDTFHAMLDENAEEAITAFRTE